MNITRATETERDLFGQGTPTQRNTQEVLDPRRLGSNNSGLEEVDIADVLCILHPCSLAAFQIVANTAARSPQHVLQNVTDSTYNDGFSQKDVQEQETFVFEGEEPKQGLDLALRFSAPKVNPALGFVFGRNQNTCDIVIDTDTVKRVSNVHFRIYVNSSGVCMLEDTSTNGTVVDGHILKGRTNPDARTRMLNAGSIIQILSTRPDEFIKFILRIPCRDNHMEEFTERFQSYMQGVALAQLRQGQQHNRNYRGNTDAYQRLAEIGNLPMVRPPLVQNTWGMHWNGGDRYNVVGHLGKGAFATVYRLATKNEGQLFAAKELEKRRFMKNGILDRKLDNELQIMRGISHPHVVQYVDYQNVENHLYIIMEYVPCGDLAQWLNTQGPLSESLGQTVAFQVLDALAYLHRKMITHRDIKPDNILIANDNPQQFTVKLSDFGLSKVVKNNETFLKTFCGTLLYCAPEVFPHYDAHVGKKRTRKGSTPQKPKFHSYSQSVDIWSLGGVLWYAMSCRPPFEGVADATGRGMFERIISTPLDSTPLERRGISSNGISLLMSMLNTDPSLRPTPQLCQSHIWFDQTQREPQSAMREQTDLGLFTLDEEEEAEEGAEPDFSQLSIHDRKSRNAAVSGEEISFGSSELDFLDPRKSKRFKVEAATKGQATVPQQRLFGEIAPSLLQSSGVFGMHVPHVASISDATSEANVTSYAISEKQFDELFASNASYQQKPAQEPLIAQREETIPDSESEDVSRGASRPGSDDARQNNNKMARFSSLEGAESDMRDLNMDSSHSADSPGSNLNEPRTPQTPENAAPSSLGQVDGTAEETPKAPQVAQREPCFNRQISLPISTSIFDDRNDRTSQSREYSSSIADQDLTDPTVLPPGDFHSLPPTLHASDVAPDWSIDMAAQVQSQPPEFARPAPRLGKLVSTPDSFTPLTLNLTSRISTWGRNHTNTFVYADPLDVRIPKRGIVVWFASEGIEKAEKLGEDWTKSPGLHSLIATESRSGIRINGVKLEARDAQNRRLYGRVHTGDVVTVCQGPTVLKFVCHINHGEGRQPRAEQMPKFKISKGGESGEESDG
ncbi:hypothetical protein MBLNU459_g3046t1 [Dothideomycetes sp. NU459]